MPVPSVTADRTRPCKECGVAVPFTRHPFDFCEAHRPVPLTTRARVTYEVVSTPDGSFPRHAKFSKKQVELSLKDFGFTPGTILESAGTRWKVVKGKGEQALEQVAS